MFRKNVWADRTYGGSFNYKWFLVYYTRSHWIFNFYQLFHFGGRTLFLILRLSDTIGINACQSMNVYNLCISLELQVIYPWRRYNVEYLSDHEYSYKVTIFMRHRLDHKDANYLPESEPNIDFPCLSLSARKWQYKTKPKTFHDKKMYVTLSRLCHLVAESSLIGRLWRRMKRKNLNMAIWNITLHWMSSYFIDDRNSIKIISSDDIFESSIAQRSL